MNEQIAKELVTKSLENNLRVTNIQFEDLREEDHSLIKDNKFVFRASGICKDRESDILILIDHTDEMTAEINRKP